MTGKENRAELCVCTVAYPGWVLLQGGQVALQSQAAAVVEQSLHSGHVGLHQLLPLAGRLLLQLLHLLLETLHTKRKTYRAVKGHRNLAWLNICPVYACLTWMRAFLSARGRFLASLSASSHSLIT